MLNEAEVKKKISCVINVTLRYKINGQYLYNKIYK
jgi:hypothetical protein